MMRTIRLSRRLLLAAISIGVASLAWNVQSSPLNIQLLEEEGVTDLMRAARDGERDNLKRALREETDVNRQDALGWTALMYAAANGDPEIVKVLLGKGANVNAAEKEGGETPLMFAVHFENLAAARLLVAAGANVNHVNKKGETALWTTKNWKLSELLRKAGAVGPQTSVGSKTSRQQLDSDTKPIPLNFPAPRYTEEARSKSIQGVVRIRLRIAANGQISSCKIISGLPFGLNGAAVQAASQVKFKPATKDGQPIEFLQRIDIEFRLRK